MRGSDERTGSLFSYVGVKARLRPDHPLRAIRAPTDKTLTAVEGDLAALYSKIGRPSIAPQMLLRAMLLQAFYSVRSERQLTARRGQGLRRRRLRQRAALHKHALARRPEMLGTKQMRLLSAAC